jgi:long-chain fatty acid transport protein
MNIKKIALLVAFSGLSASAFATNGYFAGGYGMKSIGMGGVGIALPQDSLAAATNPAGMVMVGDRMDIGASWFRPVRGADITGTAGGCCNGNLDGSDKKDFVIPEFGYNRMIGSNMSAGVSVYGNGGMNTDYKNGVSPLFNTTGARTGVDLMQLFIAPTFAYKVNKDHALGVSLNFAYQRFKAYGLGNFDNAGYSSSAGNVTDKGYDSSTGWGVKVGYVGNLTDAVAIGLTYQSKTRMGKLDKYKGLFAEQGAFDIPETYGAGITIKATPALTVAMDVQQINYGDVKSIANPLENLTVMGNQLGSNNGPGFGWQNMTVYKLGVSYAYSNSLTLRAGYSTGKQPIPASQTMFNILAPGIVEDHLTLGATWTLANQDELTVGYMHAFKKTVNGPNAIPLGGGFPGGNVSLHMYEDQLGVAYGIKFK